MAAVARLAHALTRYAIPAVRGAARQAVAAAPGPRRRSVHAGATDAGARWERWSPPRPAGRRCSAERRRATWPSHRADTHGAGGAARLSAPRWRPGGAWVGTVT